MKWTKFVLLSALCTANVFAGAENDAPDNKAALNLTPSDTGMVLPYDTPSAMEWLTSTPSNLLSFGRHIKPRENIAWIGGIAASSIVLVHYDQQIANGAKKIGRHLGMISEHKDGRETTAIASVGGNDLPLDLPASPTSAVYFLGDGLAHIGLVGGLLGYGYFNDDRRAISTASQTVEALVVTGIVVQTLKRTTGREAPFVATEKGGKWQWFPNQKEFNHHVPKYDAFPSGHLATLMSTTKVLADNYPDHTYIWPVGGTAMTLLSFAMVVNGAHWAGDYPLALGVGYLAGQVTVDRNRAKREKLFPQSSRYKPESFFLPFHGEGVTGLQWDYAF